MTDGEIANALAGHRQRNTLLRRTLADKKMSLDQQRPVDVYFLAPTQRDAAVLARELYKKGFLLKLLASREDGQWTVEAGALIVPAEILSEDFTESMVRFAAQCDATYDGWGTED